MTRGLHAVEECIPMQIIFSSDVFDAPHIIGMND